MLKKEICWTCVKMYLSFLQEERMNFVTGYFEKKWESGLVYCSIKKEFPHQDKPPDNCPYLLEQTVCLEETHC